MGIMLLTAIAGMGNAQGFSLYNPADLTCDPIVAKDLGQGKWQLTVTLHNAMPNQLSLNGFPTYPGGGYFQLYRDGVGMDPLPPGSVFLSTYEPSQLLTSQPIPKLVWGQGITLTATVNGRGEFSARTVGATDANPGNNYTTLNLLVKHNLSLDSQAVNTTLGSLFSQTKIHLNAILSFVEVPGIFSTAFNIPDFTQLIFYPVFGIPVPATAHEMVNDINSNGISLGLSGNALELCVSFETDGDELIGWLDGGPDFLVPSINADPLSVCMDFPMSFDVANQVFHYSGATATVNAHWMFGDPWPDVFDSTINKKIKDMLEPPVNDPNNQVQIEFRLNSLIRTMLKDKFGNSGRILSASISGGKLNLNVETAWVTFPGGL